MQVVSKKRLLKSYWKTLSYLTFNPVPSKVCQALCPLRANWRTLFLKICESFIDSIVQLPKRWYGYTLMKIGDKDIHHYFPYKATYFI